MMWVLERSLAWLDKILRWYIILLSGPRGADLHSSGGAVRHGLAFTGTDQLARICLAWVTFMGAAVAARRNTNIRIDSIDQLLPDAVRKTMFLIFDIMLLILLSVLTLKAYELTQMGSSQDYRHAILLCGDVCIDMVGSMLMLLFILIRLLHRLKIPGSSSQIKVN
jgi:TRAP-type C4-dicarboxylate transport system permease small subunit